MSSILSLRNKSGNWLHYRSNYKIKEIWGKKQRTKRIGVKEGFYSNRRAVDRARRRDTTGESDGMPSVETWKTAVRQTRNTGSMVGGSKLYSFKKFGVYCPFFLQKSINAQYVSSQKHRRWHSLIFIDL